MNSVLSAQLHLEIRYKTILHKTASFQHRVNRIESKTEYLPLLRWQQWQQYEQQCHPSIRPVKRSTIYNSGYVFPTIFHFLRKDQNMAFSDDLQVDLEKWELALPGSPFRKRQEIVLNRTLLLVFAISCIGKIYQTYTKLHYGSLVLDLLLAQ